MVTLHRMLSRRLLSPSPSTTCWRTLVVSDDEVTPAITGNCNGVDSGAVSEPEGATTNPHLTTPPTDCKSDRDRTQLDLMKSKRPRWIPEDHPDGSCQSADDSTGDSQEFVLPEVPTICCMSGCANCVWIDYAEQLARCYGDGGSRAREIIDQYVTDPGLKAFLELELKSRQIPPSDK